MTKVGELVSQNVGNAITNFNTWGGILFNVKAYGAKGNGTTDDTSAIQKTVNAAMEQGGAVFFPGKGPYLISSPIVIRQPYPISDPSLSGDEIHFIDDMKAVAFLSYSRAEIKATAIMDNMIFTSVITATGAGSYSNFYSVFYGLKLNGNNLAVTGIFLSEAMHATVEKCNIDKVQNCLTNYGYGVHQIIYNVFKGTETALSFESGGDSIFMHNDVYIPRNKVGFLFKPFAGNLAIYRNVFSCSDASLPNSQTTAIYLKGNNTGDDTKLLPAIKIHGNGFDGVEYGVKTLGFSSSNKNVIELEIYNNDVDEGGSANVGTLVYLENSKNVLIHGNSCGLSTSTKPMKQLAYVKNCENVRFFNNTVQSCTDDAIVLDNTFGCMLHNNDFNNFGTSATTKCGVRLTGASTYGNQIKNNRFSQNVSGGSTLGIVEEVSANSNTADFNFFEGLTNTEYSKVGGSTFFTSRLNGFTAPTVGTWLRGAEMKSAQPFSSAYYGWVCTVAGTPGTWKGYGLIEA